MDAISADEYALYLRKSVGRAGISRQRTVTTAHIERHGGKVAAEFPDTDRTAYRKVGGARPEREQFDAMLAWLPAHPGASVAAWHADRLVRSSEDTEALIRVCAAGGHLVVTPQGGTYDLSTASGRKRLRTDAVDASYEVDHLIERVVAAKAEAAADGRDLGGPRPYGWKRTEEVDEDGAKVRRLVLELAEAEAIATGIRAVLDGVSLRELARRWNAAGLRTTGGLMWKPQEVGRVLMRPRNAGLAERHGKVTGIGQWPAVVTEAEWRALRAVLADPARRTSPGNQRKHLLSGIALCGVCGGGLTVSRDSHGTPAYRCRRGGGRVHVARDQVALDAWVTEVALARLSRDDVVLPARTPDTRLLRAELAAVRGELDELAAAAGRREITVRQMATTSAALQEQATALEIRLADAARTSVLSTFGGGQDPAGVWAALSLDQKRAVIAEIMTVTVQPAPRGRPAGWRRGMPYFDRDSITLAPRDPA